MENKILDLSALNDVDYELVKKGYDDFINGDKTKFGYFGYVDKRTLKMLNSCVNRSRIIGPIIGGLIGIGIIAGGKYLLKKYNKKSENENQKTESE